MLKIALVSEHASPLAAAGSVDSGGQNIYVAQVATQLARAGCKVDVFTRLDSRELPDTIEWQRNVRVRHVRAGPAVGIPKEQLVPHMEEFGERMLKTLRAAREPYDVIHANFFMSAWAALRSARVLGIPLLTTFHALGLVRRAHQRDRDGFPDCRFEMEHEVVECGDRIIAECPQDRDDLVSLYGADPDKISVIPCGFDADEMRPMDRMAARRQLKWPDRFTVLQLGRLVPRKGIDNVIRAIAQLKARHTIRGELYVVGGGTREPDPVATPEIARLSQLALELGIAEQVHFVGRRDRHELRLYYNAADVFVTTPWYEPFGITPVEAMACARPVIGSDVGGIRTTIVDGKTGYLVPPKDANALADRLALIYSNPAAREAMGRAGRRRALQMFTWQHVVRNLAKVYMEVSRSRPIRSSGAYRAFDPHAL
jgi:glycosyltransferase involved in cell wall biosynthesis